MFGRVILLAAASVCLSACTNVPSHDFPEKILVTDVVKRINCDLKQAVASHNNSLKNWNATFELTLQVDENAAVGIDSAWITPYRGGDFTAGITAGVDTTATRVSTLKVAKKVSDYANLPCSPRTEYGMLLNSDLRIKEWVDEVLRASDAKSLESFGQNIEFVVVYNAGLKPTFALEHFTGPGGISAKRTNTHSLNIAFAPPEEKKGSGAANQLLQRQDFRLLLSPSNRSLR